MKVTAVSVLLSLAASVNCKQWYMQDEWTGNFLANMDFEVGAGTDNGGIADYGAQRTSTRRGLISVDPATNYTTLRGGIGPATLAGNRESVRVVSKKIYNDNGLFVFDVAHMPTGCGVWPALWMVGYDWPYQGELDIIEGVHATTQNMISTHTNDWCTQQLDGFTSQFAMSGDLKNVCNVFTTNVQGCGMRMPSKQSFGAPFNAAGGGTYALQWDETGIRTYFWPHGTEPADILAKTPTSENWGIPANFISSVGCPMWHFSNLRIVTNLNWCGTWAGGVWNDDLYYAGQPGSCAARTGYPTCEAYVRANGPAFTEAYWTIRSVRVYKAGRPPRVAPSGRTTIVGSTATSTSTSTSTSSSTSSA